VPGKERGLEQDLKRLRACIELPKGHKCYGQSDKEQNQETPAPAPAPAPQRHSAVPQRSHVEALRCAALRHRPRCACQARESMILSEKKFIGKHRRELGVAALTRTASAGEPPLQNPT